MRYSSTHRFPLTDRSQDDVIVPAVLQRGVKEAAVVATVADSKGHLCPDVSDLNLGSDVLRRRLDFVQGVRAVKHQNPLYRKHKHLVHTAKTNKQTNKVHHFSMYSTSWDCFIVDIFNFPRAPADLITANRQHIYLPSYFIH